MIRCVEKKPYVDLVSGGQVKAEAATISYIAASVPEAVMRVATRKRLAHPDGMRQSGSGLQ